jgi:phytoene desaturase
VPHLGSGIRWSAEAGPFAEKILRFLEEDFGLEGLRSSIEVMEMFTPDDFLSTLNSFLGNGFSIEPRLTQSALFRPHNRSEDVRRLYLVGAGTHPGGGVPGVLLGAEATEKCIVEDLGPGMQSVKRQEPTEATA